MYPVLNLDQLHVVSDLHLGGGEPFQIFGSTEELKSLILHVAQNHPEKNVGFLINGDFVDFLAEEPSSYFDPHLAIKKLERIIEDPTFLPAFEALRTLVQTERRTLLLNLGNHDLELALPWVRKRLVESICGNDAAARSRLLFVDDGTGLLVEVGDARVLCVHGNEVDAWNVADHEKIRRIARDLNMGLSVDTWVPNAGTKMVIDVMNGIKRRYPFVDLLKPEVAALVPTLLALDPAALGRLRAVLAIVGRRTWDAARMSSGFLSDASFDPTSGPNLSQFPELAEHLGAISQSEVRESSLTAPSDLLAQIECDLMRGTEPIDLVREDLGKQVGVMEAAWNMVTRKPKAEVLREAFEKLDQDRSFEIDSPDETFEQLDALIGPDIDFIIAGHTHLERALPRKSKGFYFNSGTWARLIRIEPTVRQDPQKFERIFKLFGDGSMTALDSEPYLVIKRCSVVSIWTETDGQTYGELRHVKNGLLEAVPDSRFPKRAHA